MGTKIIGYKRIFGFILPDWVDEKTVSLMVGYVLAIAVMVVMLILVISPNFDSVRKQEARLKAESEKLTAMRESKRSLDDLIAGVSAAEQTAVFRAMPLTYSPEEAVYSLRRVQNETGVSIVEYTLPSGVVFDEAATMAAVPSGGGTAIDFHFFALQITVEGPVRNILEFINRAQKSLPVAFVSDLAIQEIVRTVELKDGQANVNLKLTVQYYQPSIKSFNLSGLRNLSENERVLMRELAGYQVMSAPSTVGELAPVSAGGVRNLFGL